MREITPAPKPPPRLGRNAIRALARKRHREVESITPEEAQAAAEATARAKAAKRKGKRLEVEFAEKVGGKVVRLSGALGGDEKSNDVIQPELGEDWRYEVKGRTAALKTLYGWLRRAMGCGVDTVKHTPEATPIAEGGKGQMEPPQAVAYRADNSNWLVVVPVDVWVNLLNRYALAQRAADRGWVENAIRYLEQVKSKDF